MLEILGIILLCGKNKRNAISRGRKPGPFIAATILLWVGMEIIGAFFGAFLGSLGLTYFLAIVFALIGGLISYLIAKNCKPGYSAAPQQDMMVQDITSRAEKLNVPAIIEIGMANTGGQYNIFLNGKLIGSMMSGQTLSATTEYRQNIIQAQNIYGSSAVISYPFNTENGVHAQISFSAGRFLPGFAIFPAAFPVETPPDVRICPACGKIVAPDALYCSSCGVPV